MVWLALAADAPCGEAWGKYGAWKVRRTIAIPPPQKNEPKLPKLDCCYVTFPTANFMKPDGSDLRVVVDGQDAPFRLVDTDFGGVVRLVAAVPRTADRMYVFYGNPAAKSVETTWQPRRGVWLETRQYKGGECKTLDGIRAAWAKGGERYGTGAVGQIFHGYNPFGPSDNYLSLYKGWLYMPKDAQVHFSVVADEIAHLLVEGRVVAAKTKWGTMPRNRRFAGKPVFLKKGLHPITMYHVERGGRQAAGAAWWMTGMKRGKKYLHYKIIPATNFAPLRYGRLLHYEVRGQAIGVDFAATNDGDLYVDNKASQMAVRYVFRDMSRPANRALKCQPMWDFGDGTSSASRDPNHIYLKPGDYTVTLTLRRGESTFKGSQKIRVGHGWARAARRKWDRLAQYYPILKDYQFENMPTDHLVLAARIFESLEKPEEIVAVCSVLYQRGKTLDDKTFVHHCLLLGRHLREVEGQAKSALGVFASAQRRTKDVTMKARLANELGDVYYYFLDDLDSALRQYSRTLKTFGKADVVQLRIAQIRVGDIYRSKGDYKAALNAYETAGAKPASRTTDLVASARRGSFPRTVEDYIRRKLFKEAHQALNDWDWEFPTDRLIGYSALLRARLALAEENKKEAVKQAQELIRVNKDSEYADDLLLFLVDFYLGEGKLDKALATITQLLDGYPASDLQEQAKLKQVAIYLRQAKYDDAAKHALELAMGSEDSDNAPKALLLAATAHVRQKKKAEAIKALERLTQKYPNSDDAPQGLKMLKELRRK